jgi:hypothetical protein
VCRGGGGAAVQGGVEGLGLRSFLQRRAGHVVGAMLSQVDLVLVMSVTPSS